METLLIQLYELIGKLSPGKSKKTIQISLTCTPGSLLTLSPDRDSLSIVGTRVSCSGTLTSTFRGEKNFDVVCT